MTDWQHDTSGFSHSPPDFTESNEKIRKALDQIRGLRMYSDADLGKLLAAAFDEGFTACAWQHIQQRKDPTHPITRVNPYGSAS